MVLTKLSFIGAVGLLMYWFAASMVIFSTGVVP